MNTNKPEIKRIKVWRNSSDTTPTPSPKHTPWKVKHVLVSFPAPKEVHLWLVSKMGLSILCGVHKVDIGSINCGRIPEAYLGAGLDLFLTHQTLLDPRGTEGAGGDVSARSKQGVPLQVGADHALFQWLLVIPQDDRVRGSAIWTVKKEKMTPSRSYIYRLALTIDHDHFMVNLILFQSVV